ncbi:IS110 family transposase [Pedobacter sp. 22226]|uniref:IS110 family transposase n=1 Tax=Pedobacter sp. 22226 TaxID=3453894 RepID=UPI003F8375EF
MRKTTRKRFRFFVGIDVSRDFFDYTLKKGRLTIDQGREENNANGIDRFIQALAAVETYNHPVCVFGMEHTGVYCNHLLRLLKKSKANIVHENALAIRNSLGLVRGKTDQLDSERIASYLYKNREDLVLWKPKRDVIIHLGVLSSLREKLNVNHMSVRHTLNEYAEFADQAVADLWSASTALTLSSIKQDINDIETRIKLLWTSDKSLKELMEIMMSVPNIGEKTALQILIRTNEFKDITDPRKFACLAGIAPFPYQSGKSLNGRSRVSYMADNRLKSLLHLCSISAIRNNPEFSTYFKRKTREEGKNGMLVVNAIRFKLVLRVFACVKGNRMYQSNYLTKRRDKVLIS